MKPISGAKEEGVEGFFKGFGKGVVGLVTRPTAGVIDFASGSFGAVRRYDLLNKENLNNFIDEQQDINWKLKWYKLYN